MPRLPSIKPRQIIRFLVASGFVLDHTSGSHFIFYHFITKRRAVVPKHSRDIPKGTFLALIKEADFTRQDILDFLRQ